MLSLQAHRPFNSQSYASQQVNNLITLPAVADTYYTHNEIYQRGGSFLSVITTITDCDMKGHYLPAAVCITHSNDT